MDYRDTVRHLLATVAYRTRLALREAPQGFEDFDAGMEVRTPCEIINHMNMALSMTNDFYRGEKPEPTDDLSWMESIEAFHSILGKLDDTLLTAKLPADETCLKLLQGPLADVLTHVGQLMMLRRLAGSSVPGVNYYRADIQTGVLGPRQALPQI